MKFSNELCLVPFGLFDSYKLIQFRMGLKHVLSKFPDEQPRALIQVRAFQVEQACSECVQDIVAPFLSLCVLFGG
jgi:hypothetical protein